MNYLSILQDSVRNDYLYVFKQKFPIHLSNIILLEAKVNYTLIYLKEGKKIMVAKTLKSLEEILAEHNFLRIHRAFLINGRHLQGYDKSLGLVSLTNNYKVSTSRRKKELFEERMNKNFIPKSAL
jgi:DNA-binding LytR/AlgR family response regulator